MLVGEKVCQSDSCNGQEHQRLSNAKQNWQQCRVSNNAEASKVQRRDQKQSELQQQMHHVEHLFNNFGCFSIADAVEIVNGEGCSADAVGSGSANNNTDAEIQRELQYGCSVDSGSVNNNTVAVVAQQLVDNMSNINSVEDDVMKSW